MRQGVLDNTWDSLGNVEWEFASLILLTFPSCQKLFGFSRGNVSNVNSVESHLPLPHESPI